MSLFDQMERTGTAPKGHSEPLFCYWNKSGRSEVDVLRKMVELWFLRLPDAAKKLLRSDFRSSPTVVDKKVLPLENKR